MDVSQPSECGRQSTLNSVHGHTAALLQYNGNLRVRMSQRSTEWRECSIMTLSTIQWVPVQDKGSKILRGSKVPRKSLQVTVSIKNTWPSLLGVLVTVESWSCHYWGSFRDVWGRCWPAGAAWAQWFWGHVRPISWFLKCCLFPSQKLFYRHNVTTLTNKRTLNTLCTMQAICRHAAGQAEI